MIPVYKPYFNGLEKIYVNDCVDSTWISSKGKFIQQFEDEFAEFIGAKYATTVSNGTTALHLAMTAIGIKPGDEVIVPTFTYVASVNTILQIGAKPIFVDSDPTSWQVCPRDIERKITAKTKAIMVVHLYGHPCDMEAISEVCKSKSLLLIEDAAEAFGTQYKGRYAGTFGDVATFSFFGNKTITTGEGGMVVCRNKEVYERACHLKNQGVSATKEYWHDELAFNYRMTNIQAAIGCAQLRSAQDVLAKKRQIALWYREGFEGLPVALQPEQDGCVHTYWMCSILVQDSSCRDALRAELKEQGVETRPLFPCVNTMPHCKADGSFPVANSLSSRGINLPSFPDLQLDDVKFICSVIRNYYENK